MHGTNTSASHYCSGSKPRRNSSISVSGLIGAKRSSFPGGSPALKHLLSPPLGNGEVFLGSQEHGSQFLDAALLNTTLHSLICKLSLSLYPQNGLLGSPTSPHLVSTRLLPSQGPPQLWVPLPHGWPSWIIPNNPQPHTYVQTTHLWVHISSCLKGPKGASEVEFGGVGGVCCRMRALLLCLQSTCICLLPLLKQSPT